ncbi:PP2C family protein-serine/threonine phosphatase [Limnoglobus roseus]|uniref:Stage II sporulation protein E n=1 Tax=Limnoglobus roseus TaxID=2598579 RepID=A0A5C1AFA7_9BACT|nr:PP2C family protein-serine/threonine phosphatase [Limnoglobus roseus]QEL17490.1 stage II sporulation protein E [Limnoglobus roseus]
MASEHGGAVDGGWEARLAHVVDLMREMSRQTDPQEMVRAYGERVQHLTRIDRRISLSRRDLAAPCYRVTRSTTWPGAVNPWTDKDRLPLLEGGLVADLIYGNEPRVVDDLAVPADDPAAEYLAGHRSLLAVPLFDQGVALNMVLFLRTEPAAFAREELPELVWMSNLFGRATNTLVLSDQLRQANQALDRELKAVGEVQRSLLPAALPKIPTLDVAAYYRPSARAGGDYYDFFPLPGGRWGIFIADVSGHGSPAAVLMAVTHCIAHTNPGPAQPPGRVLDYLNQHLVTLYTGGSGKFITAFYGVYDPRGRRLTYASAGHNPPRLKRCADGRLIPLDAAGGLPLGITGEETYDEAVQQLQPGDQVLFYTDGITEAANRTGELFGTDRLDRVMGNCALQAAGLLEEVLRAVEAFADGHPADDDRTMIVARVS